ncbi:hypothetical protein DVH24_003619 [Malus domestica]|uniref:Transmembrane protein n=1 Tax=Malus domestica TaxID=3750 RepID=A0A498INR2_MALDO|nr:hypothetical protein DVH24_003619 [Malus domestica]
MIVSALSNRIRNIPLGSDSVTSPSWLNFCSSTPGDLLAATTNGNRLGLTRKWFPTRQWLLLLLVMWRWDWGFGFGWNLRVDGVRVRVRSGKGDSGGGLGSGGRMMARLTWLLVVVVVVVVVVWVFAFGVCFVGGDRKEEEVKGLGLGIFEDINIFTLIEMKFD